MEGPVYLPTRVSVLQDLQDVTVRQVGKICTPHLTSHLSICSVVDPNLSTVGVSLRNDIS